MGRRIKRAAPLVLVLMRKTLQQRFDEKVEKQADGCWRWVGAIQKAGYGCLWNGERVCLAHRIAYELFVGPIPDGKEIDHLCRNRWCVNPLHMEPVTGHENNMRGFSVAARNAKRTHCPQGHELSFKKERGGTKTRRYCKTCRNASSLRWYYENGAWAGAVERKAQKKE